MKETEVAMGQGLLLACVVGDKTEYGQLMIKLRKPRENTKENKKYCYHEQKIIRKKS